MASFRKLLNSIITAEEQRVVAEYTQKLRTHAGSYGWPSEVTDNLTISHDGVNHTVSYPQSLQEIVLTLEYGTQKVPPSPAIRTFMLGVK